MRKALDVCHSSDRCIDCVTRGIHFALGNAANLYLLPGLEALTSDATYAKFRAQVFPDKRINGEAFEGAIHARTIVVCMLPPGAGSEHSMQHYLVLQLQVLPSNCQRTR
jgi:hypothetical protein